MPENQPKSRVMENPTVSETYVNQVVGTSFDGATVGVTLGCRRVIPTQLDVAPDPQAVHVVGRLSLTPAAAADLVKGLSSILAAIAKGPSKPN